MGSRIHEPCAVLIYGIIAGMNSRVSSLLSAPELLRSQGQLIYIVTHQKQKWETPRHYRRPSRIISSSMMILIFTHMQRVSRASTL